MDQAKCENCRFWKAVGPLAERRDAKEGFCHRYSPRIVNGMLFRCSDLKGVDVRQLQEFPDTWETLDAVWPKTLTRNWCGDWESNGEKHDR